MGIVRAGHTAFPISTRNSPAAIAHLLKKTGTSHLLVGKEPIFQNLATKSLELLQGPKPGLSQMPTFEILYRSSTQTTFTPLPLRRPNMEDPAIILQSSGSTSTPKPIIWTHYFLLQLSRTPCEYPGMIRTLIVMMLNVSMPSLWRAGYDGRPTLLSFLADVSRDGCRADGMDSKSLFQIET